MTIVLSLTKFAQFPSDGLSRSTTGDKRPSNAAVRHSTHAAARQLRDCDRHDPGLRGRGLPLPFQSHVGNATGRRHGPEEQPLRTTSARPRPAPLLLFFQSFVSRDSPYSNMMFISRSMGCIRQPARELLRDSRMSVYAQNVSEVYGRKRHVFDRVHPVLAAGTDDGCCPIACVFRNCGQTTGASPPGASVHDE
jgi:hypothetical protein